MSSFSLVSVVGATAVGKTALSIELAQYFGTSIISADSRQFFRELCIGTAKPNPEEMQGIRHYLIDSLSITEPYSIRNFEEDALYALSQIFVHSPLALLVGGAGLYCKAFWEGMDEMPQIPVEVREGVQALYQTHGLGYLQAQVQASDPVYFQQVDVQNPQRLMRALEVFLHTKKPFSSFRKGEKQIRNFKNIKIGLERPKEELYERIDARMEAMLAAGLLEEVSNLQAYQHHNALQTVGYKEIFDFLNGKQNWDETIRLLKRNSRHYAKRQMTWFKKDAEIQWFHPEEKDIMIAYIEAKLQNKINLSDWSKMTGF